MVATAEAMEYSRDVGVFAGGCLRHISKFLKTKNLSLLLFGTKKG